MYVAYKMRTMSLHIKSYATAVLAHDLSWSSEAKSVCMHMYVDASYCI